MNSNDFLFEYEWMFDNFIQSLSIIDKNIEFNELIILYVNSFSNEFFGNWIQNQMIFINNLSIIKFKDHVCEEIYHFNIIKLNQTFKIKYDFDTI